jgi:hypothetical protein
LKAVGLLGANRLSYLTLRLALAAAGFASHDSLSFRAANFKKISHTSGHQF